MPLYSFKNSETGEITNEFFSIATMEQYLVDNPLYEIHHESAPVLIDPVRLMGIKRTPESFRDLLKTIKKKAGRRSTIRAD
jgi:hypothetical protein